MLRTTVVDGELCSPTVGVFVSSVPEGTILHAGQVYGRLLRLNRWHLLKVPAEADGFETERIRSSFSEVEYGTSLIRIGRRSGRRRSAVKAAVKTMISSGKTITAELDGTLYHRPAPNERPYAAEGTWVRANDKLALVEVMKTFTQVRAPFSGILKKWLVRDGAPIKQGTPLFVIEPDPIPRSHAS